MGLPLNRNCLESIGRHRVHRRWATAFGIWVFLHCAGVFPASFSLALFRNSTALADPVSSVDSELEAELSEEAPDDGETIVVTGSRRETPISEALVTTEVISRKQIEKSGADNLAEVLEEHPGVEVVSGRRGRSVRIQGMDPKYVLVLVNGQRTIGRIDGALDLSRFSVGSIERIEVVKGPSAAMYGSDALAGVINIITRKPQKPWSADARATVKARGQLDAFATAGINRGAKANYMQGIVSFGYQQGDSYDLTPNTPNTTASAYRQLSGDGRFSFEVGPAKVSLSAEVRRQDLQGVDEADTGAVFDRRSITEEVAGEMRVELLEARASATLRYQSFRDQLLRDQHDSRDFDSLQKTRQQLLLSNLQKVFVWKKHVLTGGVELSFEELAAERLSRTGQRYRGSPYLAHEWTAIQNKLVISPGIRLDADSQFGVYLSPRLVLRYEPAEELVIRVGYGRGFRSPNFRELGLAFENPGVGYVVEGNPNLTPETSHGVHASLEYEIFENLWLSSSAFAMVISDLIILDSGAGSAMGTGTRV